MAPAVIEQLRDSGPHLQRPPQLTAAAAVAAAAYIVGTAGWWSASVVLHGRARPIQKHLQFRNRRDRTTERLLWALKVACVVLWLISGGAALTLVWQSGTTGLARFVGVMVVAFMAPLHYGYVAVQLGNGPLSNRSISAAPPLGSRTPVPPPNTQQQSPPPNAPAPHLGGPTASTTSPSLP